MTVKIEIQNAEQVQRFLQSKKNNIGNSIPKSMTKAALFLQGEVKESIAGRRAEHTSVDTGRLLNSVDINVGKDNAIIFSDVEYSKFIEYGTSKFRGRRHFNNSKARNQHKVTEIIEQGVKSSI